MKMVNILQNKIKFTHKPLGEIFEEMSEIDKKSKVSKIFTKCTQELEKENVQDAWNEAVDEERFLLNFNNEDINLIKSFGSMLGKTDVDGQMSEINQFVSLLNGQIVTAEEEKNKNSKMYKSLGTIVGLGIVILLF